MKYIKDINNFEIINEALDVYDFGRKNGDLESYYSEACKLVQEFPTEAIEKLTENLPDFKIKVITNGDASVCQYYLFVELNGWYDMHWIIQYYGDYCYGIFRSNDEHDDDGELELVEFCDDIDPVITRLLRDKRKYIG